MRPIFLHGHSDTETYSFYFSHIASRLLDRSFTLLTIGSDEEYAMRKAMTHAFPEAVEVTCTSHLEKKHRQEIGHADWQ
jgi:hypothetical protein